MHQIIKNFALLIVFGFSTLTLCAEKGQITLLSIKDYGSGSSLFPNLYTPGGVQTGTGANVLGIGNPSDKVRNDRVLLRYSIDAEKELLLQAKEIRLVFQFIWHNGSLSEHTIEVSKLNNYADRLSGDEITTDEAVVVGSVQVLKKNVGTKVFNIDVKHFVQEDLKSGKKMIVFRFRDPTLEQDENLEAEVNGYVLDNRELKAPRLEYEY